MTDGSTNAAGVTPVILFRSAEEFHAAASQLHPGFFEPQARDLLKIMPAYFLYGHAIELALKSYLFKKGHNFKNLRNYGHDLQKLCQVSGHELHMLMGQQYGGMIGIICHQYTNMKWHSEFRYVQSLEPRELPALSAVHIFSSALLGAIGPVCRDEPADWASLDAGSDEDVIQP